MQEKKAKKTLEEVRKTYNLIAEEFSQSRQFIGKEFNLFKPFFKDGQHIVDLGCGNGRLLNFLDKEHPRFSYIGIDNSEAILEEAKKLHPQAQFKVGDQLKIPLRDESVDLLFNIRAFHHIPSKKMHAQALQEIKRVLKKNGVLIVTVWDLWQLKFAGDLIKAFARSIMTIGRYSFKDTLIDWNHKAFRYYYAFTPNEFKKEILMSGMKILEFYTPKNSPVENSYDFIAIARKSE